MKNETELLAKAKEYIDNGAPGCPFCEEEIDIEWGRDDYDGSSSFAKCRCYACDKEWLQDSSVTGIAVRDENDEWHSLSPYLVMSYERSEALSALLAMAEAVESAHVVFASPAQEEAIRQGIEAARRLREEVSKDG